MLMIYVIINNKGHTWNHTRLLFRDKNEHSVAAYDERRTKKIKEYIIHLIFSSTSYHFYEVYLNVHSPVCIGRVSRTNC